MHFIKTFKIKGKLFIPLVLTLIGLLAVGFIGAFHVNSMKKNLDSLYFGSLVPIGELNEILQAYHGVISKTIYQSKHSDIDSSIAVLEIQNALKHIEKNWKSYESHYKRYEELEYVRYSASTIKSTNSYFRKVLDAVMSGEDFKNLSIKLFEKHIQHIHTTLKKLINYEQDCARYERKRFLKVYESTKLKLYVVFAFILFTVFIISYNIFKSIQNEHTQLEITTKKLKIANKRLENVSYTDVLTTLYNRRYFNIIFDREINRAKRAKSFITFMMIDIDYFKQYNDIYGHMEGDKALKSVAKVLKSVLKRPGDFIFRLGGEEFGVLFSDVDESNSAALAREFIQVLKRQHIKHERSLADKYLSVSIGVVCCVADDALENEMLFNRADEMLYRAKEGGRDRYIITTDVSKAKALKEDTEDDIMSA